MTILQKLMAFFKLFGKDVEQAAEAAIPITTELETLLESKGAIAVESLIPNGVQWGAAAIVTLKESIAGLQAISDLKNPGQLKGLLQRLGSELTMLIHGKHDLAFYISAFQFVFENRK